MASPYLLYDDLVNLASDGGYTKNVTLSNLSNVFLLSACTYLKSRWLWQNPLSPIDDNEYNDILSMISQAESELMLSVDIGVIVPSVSDLSVYDKYLLMDGQIVSQLDYPDLYNVVPSSWISGTNITLPDMMDTGLHGALINNLGDIVGDNEHTLTIDEMPQHTHTQQPHSHNYTLASGTPVAGGEIPATADLTIQTPSTTSPTTAINNNTGNSQPHNNIARSLSVDWFIVAR